MFLLLRSILLIGRAPLYSSSSIIGTFYSSFCSSWSSPESSASSSDQTSALRENCESFGATALRGFLISPNSFLFRSFELNFYGGDCEIEPLLMLSKSSQSYLLELAPLSLFLPSDFRSTRMLSLLAMATRILLLLKSTFWLLFDYDLRSLPSCDPTQISTSCMKPLSWAMRD